MASSSTSFKKGHVAWNRGLRGAQVGWSKGRKRPEMSGPLHPRWKGGYSKMKRDGRFIRKKDDKLRSRIVAEEVLGRPLKSREVIHHINENPTDDRPVNLFLFRSQSAHMTWHSHRRWYGKSCTLKSNLEMYSTTHVS